MMLNRKMVMFGVLVVSLFCGASYSDSSVVCSFPAKQWIGEWKYVGSYRAQERYATTIGAYWPPPAFRVVRYDYKRFSKKHPNKAAAKRGSSGSLNNTLILAKPAGDVLVDSLLPICFLFEESTGYSFQLYGKSYYDMRISRVTKDSLFIASGCYEDGGRLDCISMNHVYVRVK